MYFFILGFVSKNGFSLCEKNILLSTKKKKNNIKVIIKLKNIVTKSYKIFEIQLSHLSYTSFSSQNQKRLSLLNWKTSYKKCNNQSCWLFFLQVCKHVQPSRKTYLHAILYSILILYRIEIRYNDRTPCKCQIFLSSSLLNNLSQNQLFCCRVVEVKKNRKGIPRCILVCNKYLIIIKF